MKVETASLPKKAVTIASPIKVTANNASSYQWDAVFKDGDLYISPETDTVVIYYSSSYKAEVRVHAQAREIVKRLYR